MIETPTLFLLGAGASHPYGFPIGRNLTSDIINGLVPGAALYQHLTQEDFQPYQLTGFREAFLQSGRYSIDAFLQHRLDHYDVGRAVIAHEIMKAEITDRLYRASDDQDWYRHLVNKMSASQQEFEKNQVAFITFNYDRSLEFYLIQHLVGAYGWTADEAAARVKQFQFVHLHGDVGELPWHAGERGGRAYSNEIVPFEIRAAASRIHIVHDELKDREEKFVRARQMIMAADRLIILGFGFDPINMERLNLGQVGRPMHATSLGLTPLEKANVNKRTNNRLNLHDLNSLDLLRHVVDLTG